MKTNYLTQPLLGLLALLLLAQASMAANASMAQRHAFLPTIMRHPRFVFQETFDSDPAQPTAWQPTNWDVTTHTRDRERLYAPLPVNGAHGANCEPPPSSHLITSYENLVYQCRSHLMTAVYDSSYGLTYLTPDHLVDFAWETAVIRFDLSTLRTSKRDWIDLYITPYSDHLQLPLASWLPDLNGEPRQGIKIEMDHFGDQTIFRAYQIQDFQAIPLPSNDWQGYETVLTPSAMERTTFELRLSANHLSFGLPDHNFWWVNTPITPLDWRQGVVQFGHHSYNPSKDCPTCTPNTWHWDNIAIAPAHPFTLIQANRRYVDATTNPTITFANPAPANAHLRFAAIGAQIEVSFDGGQTWQVAQRQQQARYKEDAFWSYWTPVPAGTTAVSFRGTNWWGGPWHARNLTIWASPTSR